MTVKVRVVRAFYGVEKGARSGDILDMKEDRAKALEKKGLVEIYGAAAKQDDDPKNKQAPSPGNKQAPDPGSKDRVTDLEALTVPELRAYAGEQAVDLGDATRRADIIAAIKLAREAAA